MEAVSPNDLEYATDEAKDELLHLLRQCVYDTLPCYRDEPVTWGDLEDVIELALQRRGAA